MSEFQPLIGPKYWKDITSGGLSIISLNGPDIDGFWAGVVKTKNGKMIGVSFDKQGKELSGNNDYNLIPASQKHAIVFTEVALTPFGSATVESSSRTKFQSANLALVFENEKLVGAKVL